MMVKLLLLALFSTVSATYHIQLGGECEKLRTELEGSDDATTKLSKLNAFLDTLGDGVQKQFWSIIDAAKADAQLNLPSEAAKTLAVNTIDDFAKGALFLPHDQMGKVLRGKFESLDEADRLAVKKMAKTYGKQMKDLIMPLLPADCKPKSKAAEDAAKIATAGGFDTPDYQPRHKRELEFINRLTSAFREFRSRRSA